MLVVYWSVTALGNVGLDRPSSGCGFRSLGWRPNSMQNGTKVSSARFNLMGCVKPAASPVGERGPSLVETVDVPPHAMPSVPSERNPLPRGVVPGSTPRCHLALAPAMDGLGC